MDSSQGIRSGRITAGTRGQPEVDNEMTEKLPNNRYGQAQFGQLHVHLPLHLLYASETMVPHHRRLAWTANFRECLAWGRMDRPCSSRYGRAFHHWTPRPCPTPPPAPFPPATKRCATPGGSPAPRWTSGNSATGSTTCAWWCPSWSPTP